MQIENDNEYERMPILLAQRVSILLFQGFFQSPRTTNVKRS